MIDNQQVKHKIIISCFPSFVDWGGAGPKTAARPGRFRGGGPSRISPSHHTPPHLSNNVPHIILPEYPSYFLTTLKGVTTGGGSYTSYATAGHVLNTFLASADAKGYDDWYIPSCGQLSLIYMYLISVNNALLAIGGQPLDTRYYWSSSEHSSNSGWIVLFNNGRTFTRYKRLTSSVRFVRDIE